MQNRGEENNEGNNIVSLTYNQVKEISWHEAVMMEMFSVMKKKQ